MRFQPRGARAVVHDAALAALFTVALAGCAALTRQTFALPDRHTIVRDQLVIHSDFAIAPHHRLLDDLALERRELLARLDLAPSDEPIYVYLLDSQRSFDALMQKLYPELPPRRAFFVQSDARLAVYAHWGDRVAEDLRHEVAHGYLHSVVPELPLWLDEGLAEYAEVPAANGGLNQPHVRLLVNLLIAQRWQPDLTRLEQLTVAAEMTQVDYAEAWVWVHWLLEGDPARRAIVQDYLRAIRRNEAPAPLSVELRRTYADPLPLLVEHLYALAPRPEPAA
jgi:hypothetical protein